VKLRAYLLMLVTVAVWGTTFVVVKDALADATPLAFNLVRMTLAFLVLSVAYRRHWREVSRGQLIAGAVVGFFLAMGYQFQTAGLVKTTPSKSAFITRREAPALECLPRRASRLHRHPPAHHSGERRRPVA
jgi:drug/metabolite transporter (DMT)-like permease